MKKREARLSLRTIERLTARLDALELYVEELEEELRVREEGAA